MPRLKGTPTTSLGTSRALAAFHHFHQYANGPGLNDAAVQVALAELELDMGLNELAIATAQRAIALDPGSGGAALVIVQARSRLPNPEAEKLFEFARQVAEHHRVTSVKAKRALWLAADLVYHQRKAIEPESMEQILEELNRQYPLFQAVRDVDVGPRTSELDFAALWRTASVYAQAASRLEALAPERRQEFRALRDHAANVYELCVKFAVENDVDSPLVHDVDSP